MARTPPPEPIRAPLCMPARTAALTFDDNGYPGFEATVLLNPPGSVADLLRQAVRLDIDKDDPAASCFYLDYDGPVADVYAAFAVIVRDWNFADYDGTPIPCSAEGMAQIPWELLYTLWLQWVTARAVPKATPSTSASTPAA